MMGSAIFVSGAVLHVRKRAFEIKLQELADRRQKRLRRPLHMALSFTRSKQKPSSSDRREAEVAAGVIRGRTIHDPPPDQPYVSSLQRRERTSTDLELETDTNTPSAPPSPQQHESRMSNNRIHFAENIRPPTLDRTNNIYQRRSRHLFSNSGVGAHGLAAHPRHSEPSLDDEQAILDSAEDIASEKTQGDVSSKLHNYVDTITGYLGRNSQFFALTEKERRQLGGIEYDALCILSYVVALYFVLFQLIGAIGCGAWMQINQPETALANGIYVRPSHGNLTDAIQVSILSGQGPSSPSQLSTTQVWHCSMLMRLFYKTATTCFSLSVS